MIAHYHGVAGMGAYGEMHVERDGYAGFADVGSGVTNVAVVVPATRVQGQRAMAPAAFFDAWIAAHPHLAPAWRAPSVWMRCERRGRSPTRAPRVGARRGARGRRG